VIPILKRIFLSGASANPVRTPSRKKAAAISYRLSQDDTK